jgi:hypothetical protein
MRRWNEPQRHRVTEKRRKMAQEVKKGQGRRKLGKKKRRKESKR